MKDYYPHIKRMLFQLMFITWIFGSFLFAAINLFQEGDTTTAIPTFLVSIFFGGFYFLIYRWYKSPIVSIRGKQLTVNGVFIRNKIIEDLRFCTLILNEESCYFRRDNEQDIIVEKGNFSASKWKVLVEDLKQLPFSEIC